jgi:hypothetical protein
MYTVSEFWQLTQPLGNLLSFSCADRVENWEPSSSHLPERPPGEHTFTSSVPGPEAVFYLNCPAGPVRLRENDGFSTRELNRIEVVLNKHVVELCGAWKEIHDNH